MQLPNPVAWTGSGAVRLLDQTRLPDVERYLDLETVDGVAEAIASLRVRGAPLIGVAAAMGVTLAIRGSGAPGRDQLDAVRRAVAVLGATRPTAVNLRWALSRMERRADRAVETGEPLVPALREEAQAIWDEDRAMCDRIGALGAPLLPADATVATICNAGALATGGIGSALAPIYHLHRVGRGPRVIVPETRPLLQGSRLTAWELSRAGVECTVIADGAIASRLRRGDIACALVGADRIAANGDVANKVGTYALALAAKAHGVPLYVLAPSSTIDPATPDGAAIPIELRAAEEVTAWRGVPAAAGGVPAWNPAFDVTPADLVSAIVTDRGVVPPGQLSRLMD
ncbi:MAG TPA: S-methyl-5-thioribose-1-phosphate isomerase [Gemmatimonadales bacterium]|nr:S-methyl-5-thioribose-1-phosphate isomerase [Gemmatimonadales bacterium]